MTCIVGSGASNARPSPGLSRCWVSLQPQSLSHRIRCFQSSFKDLSSEINIFPHREAAVITKGNIIPLSLLTVGAVMLVSWKDLSPSAAWGCVTWDSIAD